MIYCFLLFVTFFKHQIFQKNIYIGQESYQDLSFSNFEDFSLYYLRNFTDLSKEPVISLWLKPGNSFKIEKKIMYEIENSLEISSVGQPAKIIASGVEEVFFFKTARVVITNVEFFFSTTCKATLANIFSSKLRIKNCSFQNLTPGFIDGGEESTIIRGVNSDLIMENANLMLFLISNINSFLTLFSPNAFHLINVKIYRSSFNKTTLFFVENAANISLVNIYIENNVWVLGKLPMMFGNNVKQVYFKNIIFNNNSVEALSCDVLAFILEGASCFAVIESLSVTKNYFRIAFNFLNVFTLEKASFFNLSNLSLEANENNKTYIRLKNALLLELRDSSVTENSGSALLFLENLNKTTLVNNIFEGNNRKSIYRGDYFYPEHLLGSCVIFTEIGEISITQTSISNNSAINTTPGIVILAKLLRNIKITLTNSKFVGNVLFYNIIGEFSTSLHVLVGASIMLMNNCSFIKNSMNSTKTAPVQLGGPCAVLKTFDSEIYLSELILKENEAKFHSSCLVLVGTKVKIEKSEIAQNKIIFDQIDYKFYELMRTTFVMIERLAESNRGSIFISASFADVSKCVFSNNKLFRGGIAIDGYWDSNIKISLSINDTKFLNNSASNCNIIFPGQRMISFRVLINGCILIGNKAGSSTIILSQNSYSFSSFVITNSFFSNNYAEYNGIGSFEYTDQIILINNIFLENMARFIATPYPASVSVISVISDGKTTLLARGNIYQKNWSLVRACMACFQSYCQFINETFLSNEAHDFAGVYATGQALVLISCCSFFNNKARNNGACVSNSFSRIYIYDSVFVNSKALGKGAVVFSSETLDIVIKNCFITRSDADFGSIISAYMNKIYGKGLVVDCVFYNNTSNNTLFQISETAITFSGSAISNGNKNVFYFDDSEANIIDLFFYKIYCNMNLIGCTFFALKSKINCLGTFILEIQNEVDSAGLAVFETETSLVNCLILNISSRAEASAIFGNDFSRLFLRNVLLMTFNKKSIYFSTGSINITDSQFNNEFGVASTKNTVVYCFNLREINLANTIFKRNWGESGGALAVFSAVGSIEPSCRVSITKCRFFYNRARKGGAIFLNSALANISHNLFEGNSATEMGGCIYISNNQSAGKNESLIANNEFNLSGAEIGSILKWAWALPFFLNNNIKETVGDKENELVSFPVKLNLRARKNMDSEENVSLLLDVTSGMPLNFLFQISVLDTYGEVFSRINNFAFKVNIKSNPAINFKAKENAFFFGESSVTITKGVIDLSKIMLAGNSDENYFIFFTLEAIEKFFSDFVEDESGNIDRPAHINFLGRYFFRIPIKFRKCVVGEVFVNSSLVCTPCPYGEFSFDPATKCERCPEGALCTGGGNFSVKHGFWRSNSSSINIISCEEYAAHCLQSAVSACSIGYKGPLCGACDSKYFRNSFNICDLCEESMIYTYFKVMAYLLIISIICIIMIKAALNNSKRLQITAEMMTISSSFVYVNPALRSKKGIRTNILSFPDENALKKSSLPASELVDHKASYLKILVNFFQLTSIVSSLKISWPASLSIYINLLSYFSLFSVKFLSLGCVFSNTTGFPLAFIEVLALNVIFIVFLIIMSAFWFVWGRVFKTKTKRRIFISFLIIFDMVQPTLVSQLAGVLICKEIEGKLYLYEDTSVSCEDKQYESIAYGIFLPFLIIWSFALPLYLFYLIKLRSSRLFESSVFSTFGVFYNGYKPRYYFWEFFIMIRENLLIYISLLRIDFVKRVNLIFVLLVNFTYFQVTRRPYINPNINFLENFALFLSLYMVVLAYFQAIKMEGIYILISAFIILALVFLFLLFWIKGYISLFRKEFVSFINRNSKKINRIMFNRSVAEKITQLIELKSFDSKQPTEK